jgi:hypothetical protein
LENEICAIQSKLDVQQRVIDGAYALIELHARNQHAKTLAQSHVNESLTTIHSLILQKYDCIRVLNVGERWNMI